MKFKIENWEIQAIVALCFFFIFMTIIIVVMPLFPKLLIIVLALGGFGLHLKSTCFKGEKK